MLEPPRRTVPRWLRATSAAVLLLLVGMFIGGHDGWMPGWVRSAVTNQSAQDRQIQTVLGLLRTNYYRPISAQTLANRSLQGAVASLGDPYSHYFPPAQQQQFQLETNPQVSGVGIQVSPHPGGGLDVDIVYPNGPAARAGVTAGARIVAVNGRPLTGLSLSGAADLIQGRAGTVVQLTLLQGARRRTIGVTRAVVTPPVAMAQLLHVHGHRIGYIVFAQFTQGSAAELRTQIRQMLRAGARGLILDLRDNPGGLLDQAVAVASAFIPSGTIVSTRGRNQPTTVYTAQGHALVPALPLAVLVNRDTASSAEIVTAALQQRRHAVVIGTRTYGKGVFQESQNVTGGGILDITVGQFFTPDGTNLGGAGVANGRDLVRGPGIKPDIYVYDDPNHPGPAALRKAESVLGR